MMIRRLVQAGSTIGLAVLLMASSASAGPIQITYSTTPGTQFSGGTLVLDSATGAAATLTYIPNVSSTAGVTPNGVPTNVDLGDFTLVCATCTTETFGSFAPFSFDLVITDLTPGQDGIGTFVGSSTGGQVYSNYSGLTINWQPLILGPGTTNATSGSFGPTMFTTTLFTGIAAPNSGGLNHGVTTVQGQISAVPEPATLTLIGGALIGLGLLRRKRSSRQ